MNNYQNIFTRVQVAGHVEPGIAIEEDTDFERKGGVLSYWLGKIGNAQLGPIYLGFLGVTSVVFFAIGFTIIGLNMAADVNWNPVLFVREFFWLSLDPPLPEHGLTVLPPLREGLVADLGLLHNSVDFAVVGAHVSPGHCAWAWAARRLCLRRGNLALPRAGLHSPGVDG